MLDAGETGGWIGMESTIGPFGMLLSNTDICAVH